MAGRRDDSTTGPAAVSAARRVERPSSARPGTLRTAGLLVGLLLAVGATVAVFFTDDALYLRVALLAACWAFLVAAFLAGNRRADRVAAQVREAELRHAYEVELEREVAARREYELQLTDELRRETEAGMRQELSELRGEIASLTELRGDLAALAGLRTELTELTQLRADLGQLRGELSEQLSGELLIERMVMRAQSVRVPVDRAGDDPRVLDGRTTDGDRWSTTSWEEPRAGRRLPLADPRPAAPADPPTAQRARSADDEPVRRIAYPPKSPVEWLAERSLVDADVLAPAPGPEPQRLRQVAPPPPAARQDRHRVDLDDEQTPAAPRRHRRAAEPDDDRRVAPLPAVPAAAGPAVEPGPLAESSRTAEDVPAWALAEPSWKRADLAPAAEETPAWALAEPSWKRADPAPVDRAEDTPDHAEPEDAGHARLAEILAENGAPGTGGRRRRRYRDEDEPADDVLARVLGRR